MNKKRILKLADALEAKTTPVKGFNMGDWFVWGKGLLRQYAHYFEEVREHAQCGTRACLAGHTITMFPRIEVDPDCKYVDAAAAEILGLNEDQRDALFMPDDGAGWIKLYSRARAVKTLRHLAETGEVKW